MGARYVVAVVVVAVDVAVVAAVVVAVAVVVVVAAAFVVVAVVVATENSVDLLQSWVMKVELVVVEMDTVDSSLDYCSLLAQVQ